MTVEKLHWMSSVRAICLIRFNVIRTSGPLVLWLQLAEQGQGVLCPEPEMMELSCLGYGLLALAVNNRDPFRLSEVSSVYITTGVNVNLPSWLLPELDSVICEVYCCFNHLFVC